MSVKIILQATPIFSHLSDENMQELIAVGSIDSWEAGHRLCSEGDETDSMYLILSGKVKIYKHDRDGNEVELVQRGTGELIGELALLDGASRSASVQCLTEVEVFTLTKTVFTTLLKTRPQFTRGLITALTHRIRETIDNTFRAKIAKQLIEAEAQIERHRAIAQMVAGVAHEINTPLGVVNTAANMIANRVASAEMQNLVGTDAQSQALLEDIREVTGLMQKNIQRAHKLIDSFKKISVQQLTDSIATINLPESVVEIIDLFKLNARNAKLEIEFVNELTDGHTQWSGRPDHLTQVILNLLTNIERYAYPNGSGGRVEIILAYREMNGKPVYTIKVRDFGRGISPDDLPRIYEPFFTTGRSIGGSGLGMAIVYNLVNESLKGQIEIDSEPGKGTVVLITFPTTHAE